MLDGSRNGYGAGTAAYALPLQQSSFYLVIDVFAAVGGDVDVTGTELTQFLHGTEEFVRTGAFKRGQHLERECCPLFLLDDVGNVHWALFDVALGIEVARLAEGLDGSKASPALVSLEVLDQCIGNVRLTL